MKPDSCDCKLCTKEQEFYNKHLACYRCFHDLPCQLAEDSGELCISVLDRIRVSVEVED